MKVAIIGSGNIGGNLAQLFAKAGHEVVIANSRGPQSLHGGTEINFQMQSYLRGKSRDRCAKVGESSSLTRPSTISQC
jgi:predicted dinucleotide-binding enzyme